METEIYYKEGDQRELAVMPFDKTFDADGNEELCHATGMEVLIDGQWWNEYVDSNDELHYGRE